MSGPYIPATALDGTLFPRPVRLGVWIGWCEWEWSPGTWSARTFDAGLPTRGDVRFDPRDPGVAHRIADILRAKSHEVGPLLPVALGGRQGDVIAEEQDRADDPCSAHAVGAGELCSLSRPCPVARGTPQRTIRRTIPAADVSAVLLAASVAGVEAGRGVVRGVLSAWDDSYGVRWDRHGVAVAVGDDPLDAEFGVPPSRVGWSVQTSPGNILAKGPETGPGGRAAADAALLRLGYAYLDPAAPFGVVVPFLNLENER